MQSCKISDPLTQTDFMYNDLITVEAAVLTVRKTSLNSIHCDIQFGVPSREGHCVNVGICRVIVNDQTSVEQPERKNRQCRYAAAEARFGANGRPELFFPKSGILPCTERAIFRNKWLPVPVECALPAEFDDFWGLKTMESGKYLITAVSEGYVISL